MPPLELKELVAVSRYIVTQTLESLVVGSNNIKADRDRTNFWSDEAVSTLHQTVTWDREKNSNDIKIKWVKNFGEERLEQNLPAWARELKASEELKKIAIRAVEAKEMKAGNCYEMVCVALSF